MMRSNRRDRANTQRSSAVAGIAVNLFILCSFAPSADAATPLAYAASAFFPAAIPLAVALIVALAVLLILSPLLAAVEQFEDTRRDD